MANYNLVTLARSVGAGDTSVALVSGAGINKGDLLFVDKEAMPIRTVGGVTVIGTNPPQVQVARTGNASSHAPGTVGYTGPPSAFYTVDPSGVPPVGVQPFWINTKNGTVWAAQGDEVGPGTLTRYWVQVNTSNSRGALGIRTVTQPSQLVQ